MNEKLGKNFFLRTFPNVWLLELNNEQPKNTNSPAFRMNITERQYKIKEIKKIKKSDEKSCMTDPLIVCSITEKLLLSYTHTPICCK